MTHATNPPLRHYQWKKRILLVFAPSADSAWLKRQREALAHEQAGLRERDLVVIWVTGERVAVEGGDTFVFDAHELACAYGVEREDAPRILLIGKDGGVKLRSAEPVPAERLFELIDGMPMRQSEMRHG
jgi:hypothetical protein